MEQKPADDGKPGQKKVDAPPIIVNVLPTPKTDHEAEDERQERKEKAELDRRLVALTGDLAFFTAGLFVATAALVFATIALAYYAFKQSRDMKASLALAKIAADAAKESADVAGRTLIAAQRPWIYPEIGIGSDLVLDDEGARVTLGYILKNSGNTPATSVEVNVKFFAFQLGKVTRDGPGYAVVIPHTDPSAELIKFCNDSTATSEGMAKNNWFSGSPLFQGRDLVDRVTVRIPKAEIDAAREQSAYKSLLPTLLFCVTYRFPFDTKSHHTGLIFQLFRSGDEGRARELRPNDDGLIPQGHLQLLPYPFHSGVAN